MSRTTRVTLGVVSTMLVLSVVAWASTPRSQVVQVALTDFEVKFAPSTMKAGMITLVGTNEGRAVAHEIRLVKTDLPADQLPLQRDGRVDEDNSRLTTIAVVEDLHPGSSGQVTVTIKPGRYVYFCNEQNHYLIGMRGEINVQP